MLVPLPTVTNTVNVTVDNDMLFSFFIRQPMVGQESTVQVIVKRLRRSATRVQLLLLLLPLPRWSAAFLKSVLCSVGICFTCEAKPTVDAVLLPWVELWP